MATWNVERVVEFLLVIVAGAMLAHVQLGWALVAFAAVALLALRPALLEVSVRGAGIAPRQRRWPPRWCCTASR